jgi:hypothetical protein
MHRIRLILMLAVAAVLLAAPFAHGATSTVVVSQVFAGGGNAGAPFTNDWNIFEYRRIDACRAQHPGLCVSLRPRRRRSLQVSTRDRTATNAASVPRH